MLDLEKYRAQASALSKIKDPRTVLIFVWFSFYQMCLDDPNLQNELEKSRDFYEDWGDVRGLSVFEWWTTHYHLFDDEEVKEIDRVPDRRDVICLSIPLSVSTAISLPQVKHLVEARQGTILKERGLDPSSSGSSRVAFSKYRLPEASKTKHKPLLDTLIIYNLWLNSGKPKKNDHFMLLVRNFYLMSPLFWPPPKFLEMDGTPDSHGTSRFDEDQLRQLRRIVRDGEKIKHAVATGQFPGRELKH